MVCKLSSTRSLSKASREGALRENIANAAMSASGKEISVSSARSSGMRAKPFRTKRKSASAERCLRPLGATSDIVSPPREGSIWFPYAGYCRMTVYEKRAGMSVWLLGFPDLRELLVYDHFPGKSVTPLGDAATAAPGTAGPL